MTVPKVETQIRIYATDGEDTPIGKDPMLSIRSHRIFDRQVILELPGQKPITVLGRELVRAIQNAT